MNITQKIIGSFIIGIALLTISATSEAYLFGMKSRDNSVSNIQRIQEEYDLDIPIVAFIFDPRNDNVQKQLSGLTDTLGGNKIYHISISPNHFSAQQVAEGNFDTQYKQFFETIKKHNLRVIFRTMHEMNGGRYPRSSNPTAFKKAWIHVWKLSREVGLTKSNILFDMSVNARDLPAKGGKPSQTATFIQCQQAVKAKWKCPTFEDYYPGDTYVDVMGMTFYNRGKGNSNRWRGTPYQIINAAGRKTLDRLKKFNKPLFVDEVGTTAVNYEWAYDFDTSLKVYATNKDLKNQWLLQLKDFLLAESRIVGMVYFNVDLTNGLQRWTLGELDWSVIDFASNKFYEKILDVYKAGIPTENNALYYLFNIKPLTLNTKTLLVKSDYVKPIKDLYTEVTTSASTTKAQLKQLDTIKSTNSLSKKYKRFKQTDLDMIIDTTKQFVILGK